MTSVHLILLSCFWNWPTVVLLHWDLREGAYPGTLCMSIFGRHWVTTMDYLCLLLLFFETWSPDWSWTHDTAEDCPKLSIPLPPPPDYRCGPLHLAYAVDYLDVHSELLEASVTRTQVLFCVRTIFWVWSQIGGDRGSEVGWGLWRGRSRLFPHELIWSSIKCVHWHHSVFWKR